MTRSKQWLGLLWLFPLLVMAAVASFVQIQQALQNSPYASSWLKANAQAGANLAIRVESGGDTTAYNGSCCYGVLQMNRANIDRYAGGLTPEQYRQLPLQAQIDAWSRLTVDALKARSVRQLIELGTFDGRTVDGNLVLSCVQLGIGNCQKMINSGSCKGFADRNGTTICSMADKMAGAPAPSPGTGTGGTGTGAVSPGGSSGGALPDTGWQPSETCPGGCLPTSAAMREAFAQGSGMQMSALKDQSHRLGAAMVFLIMAASFAAIWTSYADGRTSIAQLKKYLINGGITLSIVLAVMQML